MSKDTNRNTIPKSALTGKPLAWLLCLIYFTSYVTRINFSAIIQEVVTDTGYEKAALSVILVCLSITYGIGQVINGKLGDIIKPTHLILCGLITATTVNLIFPLLSFSIPLMTLFWGINGFAHAMMWPPMVKILVANCDDRAYGYAVLRISWGSSFGTIAVYLLSPLVIRFFGWRAVFTASALVGLAVVVLWAILQRRVSCEEPVSRPNSACPEEKPRFRFPPAAVLPIILIFLAIIFQGMLRDGVSSWMPTYLAEIFDMGNLTAILCTVSLAIFTIICHALAASLYQRFFQNEVAFATIIFGISALSALVMFFLYDGGILIAIACMAMITGAMHAVNLMLVTHVPKRFKKYGNISTISGVINACTYVGSALSTYDIALLSEKIGWQYTVGVWFLVAVLGTVSCLLATRPWNKFMKQ